MFAGLPGIGVGTLFYVLIALWMPVVELVRVAQGTSSVERWRVIARQLFYAFSIVASIMFAERLLMVLLGEASPQSINPARVLNHELITRAPHSMLAAPVTASLLLLGAVLLTVEILRLISAARAAKTSEAEHAFGSETLNSTPQ